MHRPTTPVTARFSDFAGIPAIADNDSHRWLAAQSMARELWPENIHVAHLVIDAGVDTAWVRERIRAGRGDPDSLPPDTLMHPASVAEAYWARHHQPRDACSFEVEMRPYCETW